MNVGRSRGAVLLAREARSGDEIAERVGVSRISVSKWLNGHAKPTATKRADLLAAYGIPAVAWDEVEKPAVAPPPPPGTVPPGVLPKASMLEQMVHQLMSEVMSDPDATPLERSKVMRNCSASLRELSDLTEVWDRYERAIERAVTPFPSAAKAILDEIRKVNENRDRSLQNGLQNRL